MIITRTPYRVSFFGGGTDLPVWFQEHGGSILSAGIDHYSWITARWFPPFFANKHRIVWSHLEVPDDIEDIRHPAVRAALQTMGFENDPHKGLDLTVLSDLPARAGLGSSSTFTVGVLQALHTLQGSPLSTYDLAKQAIHLERTVMAEAGGIQDQIAAAFGGLNEIAINPDGSFTVNPLNLSAQGQQALEDHCLLFFSGLSRSAASIEVTKTANLSSKKADLSEMQAQVATSIAQLRNGQLEDFGLMLHEAWQMKRALAANVSTTEIDELYRRARLSGALGGKLLGAGGGGFFLVFAKPENHEAIKKALAEFIYVPFRVSPTGCTVVVNSPREYDDEIHHRRDNIYPAQSKPEKQQA